MQERLVFSLLIIAGLNLAGFGQSPQYKYTPKHFVTDYDSSEFKSIIPSGNGFVRIYQFIQRIEIWDTDYANTTQITGWAPALVCIEGNIQNDKKKDVFKTYLIDSLDHSRRYKIAEQTYFNDKLNGEWRSYSLNGAIAKVNTYKNDSLNGVSSKYAIDGKTIEEKIEYFNGSTSYIVRAYFKSGKLERESQFKNGLLNGAAKTYYENGRIKEIVSFLNGIGHGLTTRYYENGNLEEQLNIANGQFHGIRKYYHSNGRVWSVEEYKKGLPWNAISNYTDKGIKRDQGTLKNGNGTLIYYDDNGTIIGTMNFINGIQQ